VQPGTTNLEEAFKHLLATDSSGSENSTQTDAGITGRIRLSNAVVYARDSVDLTAWEIKLEGADIPLPSPEQPFPPMTLVGQLIQTAALAGEVPVGGSSRFKLSLWPNILMLRQQVVRPRYG
jgi:hypothetical protein